ncbi:pseudouridine synthase [Halomonas urumqiensis]|uniref:tRNA pseudouridine synthase C n=1 Tax=Halomonas urumqiensis TaxID=1684789 RepID=A0A2N7UEX1_9GAMM|nr:pseudouridine synthase [Halomonas urumqiensis]PMR78994.1 pseudouridylate synthase [Halomonas urumqiensis]PTB00988.1 pseudouridylate synthase [Halomonas urumqiensis]GHE22932.1 tRNA pseudouridine(65) synthase TruC [Halomonas urumqiensis]
MSDSLRILHRDDHLVAVHKPAGLLVHRTALARGEHQFLLQRLRDQLGQRVYPVHRLDRPTSGVMVFALNSAVAAKLTDTFTQRRVTKRYLAVVRGVGPEGERLDTPLREEDGSRHKAEMPAMEAITDVSRLDSVELPVQVDRYPRSRYSLMEARPLTGRRHQIRRHLASRGYPIIGDAKHGKGNHNRFFAERLEAPRLLLAAVSLAFDHPMEESRLELDCALDTTMTALFNRFGWAGHLPVDSARSMELARS